MADETRAEQRVRRRGRRPARPDPGSGPVGAFADRLWRLRQEAGDPSYGEMAGRLRAAASKSSLAAAAQGRTLPSWETTWEFVRVLAVDRLGRDAADVEKEWREHWTRARAAEAEDAVAPPAEAETPAPQPRSRRHLGAATAAAVAAALAGAALTVVVLDRKPGGGDAGATPAVAALPDRDDSRFEGDITYPDGTLVPPDSSFTKIWRLRNTGTVAWANRFLARVNETPCQAPQAVPVPQTLPGETVDIEVPVRTPGGPGRCKIYWKMADEQGRTLFPMKRPIFLDVRVGKG
ncbi:NBR1-Ig-like domain-containing protein [Pseudosporangium ferrugineum]|uniref:NBR1-Ig-like domain-containing protein n=1 Tax=Pseudosporangium ferrugineum TaxID=439699 RepID=UPI001B805598|nr:NBR1-Ig-like domain-containing protein [Pseudosporangium ferrugineum]